MSIIRRFVTRKQTKKPKQLSRTQLIETHLHAMTFSDYDNKLETEFDEMIEEQDWEINRPARERAQRITDMVMKFTQMLRVRVRRTHNLRIAKQKASYYSLIALLQS